VIADALIEPQEGVSGGAEEILLDLRPLGVGIERGAASEIVSFCEGDHSSCFIKCLYIAPRSPSGKEYAASPAVEACRVAGVILGKLQEDAADFLPVLLLAANGPCPSQREGRFLCPVMQPGAVGGQRLFV